MAGIEAKNAVEAWGILVGTELLLVHLGFFMCNYSAIRIKTEVDSSLLAKY